MPAEINLCLLANTGLQRWLKFSNGRFFSEAKEKLIKIPI